MLSRITSSFFSNQQVKTIRPKTKLNCDNVNRTFIKEQKIQLLLYKTSFYFILASWRRNNSTLVYKTWSSSFNMNKLKRVEHCFNFYILVYCRGKWIIVFGTHARMVMRYFRIVFLLFSINLDHIGNRFVDICVMFSNPRYLISFKLWRFF